VDVVPVHDALAEHVVNVVVDEAAGARDLGEPARLVEHLAGGAPEPVE
jgi:hypothetical protein